jgi:hypothetical protein
MHSLTVPPEIEAVFREFRTCEFSTLAKDGTPITWPTLPFWQPQHDRFLVTTSIGLPQKALNVRRNPRVSLLFSDPTASGLSAPPAVLVQGDARSPDRVSVDITGFEEELGRVFRRQPASGAYSSNPVLRSVFDWYYMRLEIAVRPRRILWWPYGDFSQVPHAIEVSYVG